MRKLKIDFCDFWKGFDKTDNYFWKLLSKRFELELTDNPDYLIYSAYGRTHRSYNCIKIYYTSENVRPDMWECDFAFSFDYRKSNKHYRLPLFVLYDDVNKLIQPKDIDAIVKSKTKFCNFVYSNSGARERIDFFNKLSKYKKIDSGGKVLNNLGYPVQDKLSYIKDYKFTIAFENSSYPGYTTEKIFHPMLVCSIPIYWGNPLIGKDFNPQSYVNTHDYKSFDDVIDRIIEIDQHELLYRQYLGAPYFPNNKVPDDLTEEKILDRFEEIFNSKIDHLNKMRLLKQNVSFLKKDTQLYSLVLKNRLRKSI